MAAPWYRRDGTEDLPSRRLRHRPAGWAGVIGPWALGFALAGVLAAPCAAATLSVSIDTSALNGTTGARFDFSLLDGDLTANNSVTISNLATDGTLGDTDCSIGCVPSFTLDDALGLGQFLQDLTLGNVFSFDLDFSTNFSGTNAPDRLALNLLQAGGSGSTLVDTDLDFLDDPVPAQDALLIVDLMGDGRVQRPTTSNPTTPVTAVPEPGSLAMAALGLLALTARRVQRLRRPDFFSFFR
jgi:hypothetical protein